MTNTFVVPTSYFSSFLFHVTWHRTYLLKVIVTNLFCILYSFVFVGRVCVGVWVYVKNMGNFVE